MYSHTLKDIYYVYVYARCSSFSICCNGCGVRFSFGSKKKKQQNTSQFWEQRCMICVSDCVIRTIAERRQRFSAVQTKHFFFVENCKSILLEWTISLVIMARRQEANSLNKNKIFQAIFVWIFHRRVSGTDFIVSLLNDELAYHTEMAFFKIQNGAQDILLVAKAKEWVAMEGWIPEQYVYLHVYTFPWHAHAQ